MQQLPPFPELKWGGAEWRLAHAWIQRYNAIHFLYNKNNIQLRERYVTKVNSTCCVTGVYHFIYTTPGRRVRRAADARPQDSLTVTAGVSLNVDNDLLRCMFNTPLIRPLGGRMLGVGSPPHHIFSLLALSVSVTAHSGEESINRIRVSSVRRAGLGRR